MSANSSCRHDRATARILEDLRPVRRLARPAVRAVPAGLLALLMAVLVFVRFGVRHDALILGSIVLWGLTAVQMAFGVLLILMAIRTAVPGRAPARRRSALLLLGGAALLTAVTALTWFAHSSHVPPGQELVYWVICLNTPLVLGLPALGLTLALAFRAYPTHPLLTGALAGLGAGLVSDGSWRTFCEVSDPVHVLSSHTSAVVALTAAGMLIAWIGARRR